MGERRRSTVDGNVLSESCIEAPTLFLVNKLVARLFTSRKRGFRSSDLLREQVARQVMQPYTSPVGVIVFIKYAVQIMWSVPVPREFSKLLRKQFYLGQSVTVTQRRRRTRPPLYGAIDFKGIPNQTFRALLLENAQLNTHFCLLFGNSLHGDRSGHSQRRLHLLLRAIPLVGERLKVEPETGEGKVKTIVRFIKFPRELPGMSGLQALPCNIYSELFATIARKLINICIIE